MGAYAPRQLIKLKNHFSVTFNHLIDFDALMFFRTMPRGEIEFMGVERTNDFARTADSLGKRALTMRTPVLRCKQPPVPLSKDGNFLAFDDIASG